MRVILATISLAFVISASPSEARRAGSDSDAKIKAELAVLRSKVDKLANVISTQRNQAPVAPLPQIWATALMPVEATAKAISDTVEKVIIDPLRRVFPADCTQRGQWLDQRRTHRHAGIDCGGDWGSPIVAPVAGVVLPRPGGDRGYGPSVVLLKGDDGLVYRLAHLNETYVKVGEHVTAGQQVGTMGKVGRRGFPHLHLEIMTAGQFKARPYGVHALNPNKVLGGSRGTRMAAGDPIEGGNIQLASLDDSIPVIERTRIKRRQARRHSAHHRYRHHRRYA